MCGSRTHPLLPLAGDATVADRDIDGRNVAKPFTAKQGHYLAHIYYFTKIHGRPPAEPEIRRIFTADELRRHFTKPRASVLRHDATAHLPQARGGPSSRLAGTDRPRCTTA
jgi:hypothetical protein